jgi:hypothetical protein
VDEPEVDVDLPVDSPVDNGETGIVDLGAEGDDGAPALLIEGDVGTLLAKARQYLETGLVSNGRRFTSPPGDNATDIYKAVLVQDPGNVEASNGLQRVADFYEARARSMLDRGIIVGCAALADEGLKAAPGRQSLLDLRAKECKSQ